MANKTQQCFPVGYVSKCKWILSCSHFCSSLNTAFSCFSPRLILLSLFPAAQDLLCPQFLSLSYDWCKVFQSSLSRTHAPGHKPCGCLSTSDQIWHYGSKGSQVLSIVKTCLTELKKGSLLFGSHQLERAAFQVDVCSHRIRMLYISLWSSTTLTWWDENSAWNAVLRKTKPHRKAPPVGLAALRTELKPCWKTSQALMIHLLAKKQIQPKRAPSPKDWKALVKRKVGKTNSLLNS